MNCSETNSKCYYIRYKLYFHVKINVEECRDGSAKSIETRKHLCSKAGEQL